MKYAESCFVVENLFSRTHDAAVEFLKRLQQSKESVRVGFLFHPVASRTIERLLKALMPVQDGDVEVCCQFISCLFYVFRLFQLLTLWSDLIIDNWQDVVFDRSAAHLPRTLGQVLSGQSQEQTDGEATSTSTKRKMLPAVRQLLARLYARAFDYQTMSGKW